MVDGPDLRSSSTLSKTCTGVNRSLLNPSSWSNKHLHYFGMSSFGQTQRILIIRTIITNVETYAKVILLPSRDSKAGENTVPR